MWVSVTAGEVSWSVIICISESCGSSAWRNNSAGMRQNSLRRNHSRRSQRCVNSASVESVYWTECKGTWNDHNDRTTDNSLRFEVGGVQSVSVVYVFSVWMRQCTFAGFYSIIRGLRESGQHYIADLVENTHCDSSGELPTDRIRKWFIALDRP